MLLQDHRDSLMCTMRALKATEWEILSGGSGLRALADQCPGGGKPCLKVVLGVHSRPSSEANPLTCSKVHCGYRRTQKVLPAQSSPSPWEQVLTGTVAPHFVQTDVSKRRVLSQEEKMKTAGLGLQKNLRTIREFWTVPPGLWTRGGVGAHLTGTSASGEW